jgi:hypothetical protein
MTEFSNADCGCPVAGGGSLPFPVGWVVCATGPAPFAGSGNVVGFGTEPVAAEFTAAEEPLPAVANGSQGITVECAACVSGAGGVVTLKPDDGLQLGIGLGCTGPAISWGPLPAAGARLDWPGTVTSA